ncbi:hypothetical protein BT96DRAFT_150934 [Gymnopus androsaceus JB14]|uniref:Uncharacterized protein n=1 Tax=Gymnopus androsaceus JB14 TaxID=1447944 RepID=A0A6A4I978_9AGAR|nr:hypothetical protein BT96DRAFT_150934 [Gymnopus androsaceus JB14]
MSQYLSQNRIEEPIWLEPIEISFLQKKISETESQVESLEAQISELTCQRDSKLVELASFRNIIAPIRRIPMEILSEIFELAHLPNDGIFHSKHDIVLYTHNFSSVCAAWRKVALATPRLWSKLCFHEGYKSKPFESKAEQVKEWINRSRGLPLDVYLCFYREASSSFLEQILNYCHRIRTLDVAGYLKPYAALFNLPRSSFPQLNRSLFQLGTVMIGTDVPNKIQAFLDAPNYIMSKSEGLHVLVLYYKLWFFLWNTDHVKHRLEASNK